MEFFKASDFYHNSPPNEQAGVANTKLEKALGPKVYGTKVFDDQLWSAKHTKEDTHQGYIFQIEEIKKECVKHEPKEISKFTNAAMGGKWDVVCKYCGIELKATWSAK